MLKNTIDGDANRSSSDEDGNRFSGDLSVTVFRRPFPDDVVSVVVGGG